VPLTTLRTFVIVTQTITLLKFGTIAFRHCFFFFFFIVVVGGGILWHLHKFLQYHIYIILEYLSSSPLSISFIFPSSLEEFQQLSFFHLHICIQSICNIFTLPHLSPPPPLPTGINTPTTSRTCSLPSWSLIL
jgi:hypothetical protein